MTTGSAAPSRSVPVSPSASKHLYNEMNPYRAAVLRARIAEGRLPCGHVDERDITTIPDHEFAGFDQIHLFAGIGGFPLGLRLAGIPESGARIVTGGFPCQDISNAGKRAGISGSRSGLWREMVRCIRVVQPQLVFVENVAALLGRGMGTVVGDLAAIGYDARWDRVSAADVGAWHFRERIWIVAHNGQTEWRPRVARGQDSNGPDAEWEKASSRFAAGSEGESSDAQMLHGQAQLRHESNGNVQGVWNAANAHGGRFEADYGLFARESESLLSGEAIADDDLQRSKDSQGSDTRQECSGNGRFSPCDWWAAEPAVDRMVYGVPRRVDRLAALGDTIVPQACAEAVRRLLTRTWSAATNEDEGIAR